jgi:hypothetical protein
MNSIASYLSINSQVFPRISNMSGGAFICTCPTDGQPDKYGKTCVCEPETGETTTQNTENISAHVLSNTSTTDSSKNPPPSITNLGYESVQSAKHNYDTYTEPQTESEA